MPLKIGTRIPVRVSQEAIDASEPCREDECMFTLGAIPSLEASFGRQHFYPKSTTNGLKFTLDGYRYTCAFPPAVAKKIFKYDKIFTQTGSKRQARDAIRPFKTCITVIDRHKIAPPASPERRKYQNDHQKKLYHQRKAAGLSYQRYSGRREISVSTAI